jgi:molecular chaperone GrpE
MSEEFKKDADESGAEQSNEASPQEIDSNSVEAEFLSLRQQLETKETEAKNYYERLLRQAAELENYKKRSGRERDDAIRYANESLLKDLLPVVDNLERAIAHASGQPFDPTKHEAMTQVETDDHEPNSVVEELHKGYMLRDRLLRPALVSVAKAVKTREKKNHESKVENGQSDD